jgi:hypothetical protein
MNNKYELYSYVQKRKGYKFPGMVIAVFETRSCKLRYVVEAYSKDFEGCLHIFSEDDLEQQDEK